MIPNAREWASRLVALDTSPDGPDHDACVELLQGGLAELGFSVSVHAGPRPTLVARRSGTQPGKVLLYGHYDTDDARGPDDHELREDAGRWYGLGIADDKGPLAARLAALAQMHETPALVWCIQGEEETGSQLARVVLPTLERADLYIDETGYHGADGAQRILVTGRCDGLPDRLARAARGIRSHTEARRLNKSLVPGGCPFQRIVPDHAAYLAIGPNDDLSTIHAAGESIPEHLVSRHEGQLRAAFDWLRHEGMRR